MKNFKNIPFIKIYTEKHLVEETKYTNKKVNIFNNIPSISNLFQNYIQFL